MKATDWDWHALTGVDGPAEPAVLPVAAVLVAVTVGVVALAANGAAWAQALTSRQRSRGPARSAAPVK